LWKCTHPILDLRLGIAGQVPKWPLHRGYLLSIKSYQAAFDHLAGQQKAVATKKQRPDEKEICQFSGKASHLGFPKSFSRSAWIYRTLQGKIRLGPTDQKFASGTDDER